MKRAIIVMLTLAISTVVYAGNEPKTLPSTGADFSLQDVPGADFAVFPDKLNETVINEAVILDDGQRQFCSGMLARDTNGEVHVYTAAHCCAIYRPQMVEGVLTAKGHVITKNGLGYDTTVTLNSFGKEYLTNDGVDACEMDIVRETATIKARIKLQTIKTKIAPLGYERLVRLVSPFPNYSEAQRFQTMLIVGFCFDHPIDLVVTGEFRPGMSGSPILNYKGELVGFAIAAYINTAFPVGIISVMEASGFLDDSHLGTNEPNQSSEDDVVEGI